MSKIQGRTRTRLWAQTSDYARLQRELKSFQVEFASLEEKTKELDTGWVTAARSEIGNVQEYLTAKNNIEGGWVSLHAARRHAVFGMSVVEQRLLASMLRAEAPKIVSWRGQEMMRLLDVPDAELTAYRVTHAMALRDEYFSNQYHKLWLVGSQIAILLYACGVGLLLLVPLVVSSSRHPEMAVVQWGYQIVAAVLFFGLLGAAFSAAGSLMNADATSKIPERVANQFVTIARALLGAGVGLAGYAMYQSRILMVHFGDDREPGSALAVAFLFGFAGERIIAQVLGSLGPRQTETK